MHNDSSDLHQHSVNSDWRHNAQPAHTTKKTTIARQCKTHRTLHRCSTWRTKDRIKNNWIRHPAANTVSWTPDDERVTLETCRALPSNKEHKKLHLVCYLYYHYILRCTVPWTLKKIYFNFDSRAKRTHSWIPVPKLRSFVLLTATCRSTTIQFTLQQCLRKRATLLRFKYAVYIFNTYLLVNCRDSALALKFGVLMLWQCWFCYLSYTANYLFLHFCTQHSADRCNAVISLEHNKEYI